MSPRISIPCASSLRLIRSFHAGSTPRESRRAALDLSLVPGRRDQSAASQPLSLFVFSINSLIHHDRRSRADQSDNQTGDERRNEQRQQARFPVNPPPEPPFHFAIPYLRPSPLRLIYSRPRVWLEQPTVLAVLAVLAVSVAQGFTLLVQDRVDQFVRDPNRSPATLAHEQNVLPRPVR